MLDQKQSKIGNLYTRIFGLPEINQRVRAYHVIKHLNPRRNETILDAGCGLGAYLSACALRDSDVIGIDVSREHVRQASKSINSNVKRDLIIADICNIPFKKKLFDKVLCIDVLEHINTDFKAVAEMSSVLSDNGRLIIHVPQLGGRFYVRIDRDKTHVRVGYSLVGIRSLLQRANLVIDKFEETYKAFAGSAFEIEFKSLRFTRSPSLHTCLASLLFPLLYSLSKLDFLSTEKGGGLLVVCKTSNQTS